LNKKKLKEHFGNQCDTQYKFKTEDCSKKDDTFIDREYYKIIVGSVTDKKKIPLYHVVGGLL